MTINVSGIRWSGDLPFAIDVSARRVFTDAPCPTITANRFNRPTQKKNREGGRGGRGKKREKGREDFMIGGTSNEFNRIILTFQCFIYRNKKFLSPNNVTFNYLSFEKSLQLNLPQTNSYLCIPERKEKKL